MARLIRALPRPYPSSLSSSSSAAAAPSSSALRAIVPCLQHLHPHQQCHGSFPRPQNATFPFFVQTRAAHAAKMPKSRFDSNILRILRSEIQYLNDHSPPQEPVIKFKLFSVDDCTGKQYIRLRRQFGLCEIIQIEVTMFDGCVMVPKPGENRDNEHDLRLHLSLIVDIYKTDFTEDMEDAMEFVCSVWPDRLEIEKVYMVKPNRSSPPPYMGPDFRNLDAKVRGAFREFLEERGIDDELSVFLHKYMWNKDRTELIEWLEDVESFMKK